MPASRTIEEETFISADGATLLENSHTQTTPGANLLQPEKALNLVFFGHSAQLAGAERSLLGLVDDLINYRGAVCTVILPEHGPLEQMLREVGANVAIMRFNWWCGSSEVTRATLTSILSTNVSGLFSDIVPFVRDINPDVIVTQTMVIPWGAAVAATLSKPHIWSVCEYGELDHGLRFVEPIDSIAADIEASSDFVFFVSNDIRNALYPDLTPEKYDVLYRHIEIGGVDNATPVESTQEHRNPVVGLFGTLAPSKGQADAIAALAELKAHGTSVELVLAGGGHPHYVEELTQRAHELGVENLVRFSGFLETPYPAMRACDILLVCSRKEAFGRAAAEAMLLAKPLIYAGSGGVAEYVEDGKTGLSYSPGDFKALADRIETLLHDKALAGQLGQAAEVFARATFTRENYGAKFYAKALTLRGTPSPRSSFPKMLLPVIQEAAEIQVREMATLRQEFSASRHEMAMVVEARKDEISGLARQLSEFQANVAEFTQQVAASQAHSAQLEQQLAASQTNSALLEQQLVASQTHSAQFEQQLAASQTNSALLEQQLAAFQMKAQSWRWISKTVSKKLVHAPLDISCWVRRAQKKLDTRGGDYQLVARSGLFDGDWYLAQNADVRAEGVDPLDHYLRYGGFEGRAPSPKFDSQQYLDQNPDLAKARINPLAHHVRHGGAERRISHIKPLLRLIEEKQYRKYLSSRLVLGFSVILPGSFAARMRRRVEKNESRSTRLAIEAIQPVVSQPPHLQQSEKQQYREQCLLEFSTFLSGTGRISFPRSENPKVSIILILFNQAELTLQCLLSLVKSVDTPAELIIIDNASSDSTPALCTRIDGATIIRNEMNLHFLRGVNQAAAIARGDAVLLLNNDTSVKPGSIGAAYDLLKAESDIGAVGGRIVLLNGTLQEAGSIIWRDGSCAGYGRGYSPSMPEFQFRRDVDYCSGAFLLVRRSLFSELNYFDTAFAPAYYEETDLCMRIRKVGFRVVYEPRVEITHFEFGSSSSSDDAIALQRHNWSIFLERHKDVLGTHCAPRTRDLDARMIRHHTGRILIIDDQIPHPALGSGFPRARSIYQAIHDANWFITLYPLTIPTVSWDDAYRIIPPDVEIIAGHGVPDLASFLRNRVGYYDAVLVSRPHNMKLLKQALANVPDFLDTTTLIYDAEALFSVREELRLKVVGTPLTTNELNKRLKEEIFLCNQSASVIAVNEIEAEIFRSHVEADVHVLGHSLVVQPTTTKFDHRSDILFVGALDDNSSPNVDSLVWFVHEVMPILNRMLGISWHLHVVGRNKSRIVRRLAGSRIHLHGMVDDVREFYERSRLFVAPTRFAAGIPMKMHEAAAAGVPSVATTLLAHQLGWTAGIHLLTGDTSADFAAACARLYSEEGLWNQIRENAIERVRYDCDPNKFRSDIKYLLESLLTT